jgi:hypothetical protein
MSTITPSPGQSSMADVVLMLQTAYPRDWENHLRNFFGASVPADLPPAELARFTERVSWMVKQAGIKDPAGWLAFQRAQEEKKKEKEAAMALAAAIEWEALIETGDETPIQRDSVEPEPVKLGGNPVCSEPPASAPAAAVVTLSPSEIAKDKITIGGDLCVSFASLASLLGISERTLSRRTENGNGPPHVYISGNYYPLDKAREWAAARGLLKTPSDNH